jgi:hypothetical protein
MKIRHLKLENFKGIQRPFQIDFSDEFGQIRDLTIIVRP